MNTIQQLIILLFVTLPLQALAQSEETGFTADRPGATTGPDVLPRGRVQWETGVGWEHTKIDDPAAINWTVNTSMLRWGFSDMAELRLQADWQQSSAGGRHYGGLANVAVGTKVRLFDGWKAIPTISLLGNVLVPGGSDANYLPEYWGGQIGLLFQNQLTPWLSLGYQGELTWSDKQRPTAFFGLCLGFALSDRLSLAVEEYNHNTSDGTDCWSEVALSYMLTPRLQVDIGTDISLSHFKDSHNLMIGLAWQITKK